MTVRIWVNPRTISNLNCLFLSLTEMQSSSDKKHNKSLSRSVFPFPLLFRRLSTVFFIDSETNETIPLHFKNVFHFFNEKNSWSKSFLVECMRNGNASCNKRREFLRNSYTSVASDWMYRFSHTWKNIVCDSDWTYHFFHVWKPLFVPLIG